MARKGGVSRAGLMAAKPHWLAISVAFDAQGESVPKRGVTSTNAPFGSGALASDCALNKLFKRSSSPESSGAFSSTKYQYSAAKLFSLLALNTPF